MIELRKDIFPSQETLNRLQEYQDEIDILPTFPERSLRAKELFSRRNRKSNSVFNEVKARISELCNNTRRCVYCEDSLADEIEHIFPKDLYPEKCFQWENYLYACGQCNRTKNNQFAIFRNDNGEFQAVNPPHGIAAMEPPPPGIPAFINPREENPMDFCILDLSGTFKFVVFNSIHEEDKIKAEYTFNTVLRLNEVEREPIRQARENAYSQYRARFFEFVSKKRIGESEEKLKKMIDSIKNESHTTVWKEMQRYHLNGWLEKIDPDLDDLFISEPEALSW